MAYQTIIGLEIHSELLTESKMFCSCKNVFGAEPNTHCCPTCLGMPGTLPRVNKFAVECAIKAGLSLNCEISNYSRMDRKNYFYPDLVKGYQITQDEIPLCIGGYIEIETETGPKKIRLERIHIEEDTGKSMHLENGDSLLDYNRCGVPLIEIVSKPDMNSPEEARNFLDSLKNILKYIAVSDCKMEEGSLRCDVNINVVDEERGLKSKITEIKNLNSFRSAVRAMEFEEKRHRELLDRGENTEKETRRWDEVRGETIVMRKKVIATDYRYFPEGDLPPLYVSPEWVDRIRQGLPELPKDKKERFVTQYFLSNYDASILASARELSDFFESLMKLQSDSKLAANWLIGEVLRILKEEEKDITQISLTPEMLSDLLEYVKSEKINNNTGKKVLKEMVETSRTAEEIIKDKGLIQISDESSLQSIVSDVIAKNPQSVEDYKNGKNRAMGFLVGQVMKASQGKANPKIVNSLVEEALKSL